MINEETKEIIYNYVEAYISFDVGGLLICFIKIFCIGISPKVKLTRRPEEHKRLENWHKNRQRFSLVVVR